MKLTCIAVDDDIISLNLLENVLNRISYLEISGIFRDAASAIKFLKTNSVDILFLDIEMPDLTGIEMLKNLTNPPRIIIVSGNPEYALESYEFNVFDYILKPVRIERIQNPIHRIFDLVQKKNTLLQKKKEPDFLFLKENKKMIKVDIKNILFFESMKDYVKVVCSDKIVVTKQNITFFENLFSELFFVRIHKSFLISTQHIDAYDSTHVEIGKIEIPIGRSYKKKVLEILETLNNTIHFKEE